MTGMITVWCSERNRIPEIVKNPGKNNLALVPCRGPACGMWKEGNCFHIERVRA